MANRISWVFLLLSISSFVSGQILSDAVQYSMLNYSSSARAVGAGNAFSSLGAELSTASTNPAGIAEFRKSEFVLTLDYLKRNNTSEFAGNLNDNSRSVTSLNQLAAVFVRRNPSSVWETMNLAIGVNTTNLFHQNFNFQGNSPGTIVERFTERANGLAPGDLDNFEAGLAFDVQLLYDFENDDIYESDFGDFLDNVDRSQVIERKGSQKEIFITLGGNMKNKISVGATLGIPILRFEETKVYRESDPSDVIPFFVDLEFVEFLETTGVGLNGKIGIIYKVNKNLRFGAAIHSPSLLFLRDVFTTDIIHTLITDQTEVLEGFSPESNFKYRLTTPLRMIGGASYLVRAGKIRGFISAEAEYVSYTQSKFNLTSNSEASGDLNLENDLNDQINTDLTSAINVRLGAEIGYSAFRFRVGYEQMGNPYRVELDDISPKYSIGLGIRGNKNYFDIAYQIQDVESEYTPYLLSNVGREQSVTNQISNTNIIATAGFKF